MSRKRAFFGLAVVATVALAFVAVEVLVARATDAPGVVPVPRTLQGLTPQWRSAYSGRPYHHEIWFFAEPPTTVERRLEALLRSEAEWKRRHIPGSVTTAEWHRPSPGLGATLGVMPVGGMGGVGATRVTFSRYGPRKGPLSQLLEFLPGRGVQSTHTTRGSYRLSDLPRP